MSMTLVGLFEDKAAAQRAADELDRSNIARERPRISDAVSDVSGLISRASVPRDDAEIFEEGVRRGGTLLTAVVEDARAEEAQRILKTQGMIDVRGRADQWRAGGWSGGA